MSTRKGNISVKTQDIFPIIKKWLYSDHDIFLRELIANATDAVSKRSQMSLGKNLSVPTGALTITIDKTAGTLSVTDNGLGMTEQEVEKYLAQLAFSGAQEFVDKMKKEGGDQAKAGEEIIGKFGLGFYSVFMVSDKVVVDSLSMSEGAKAVRWSCDGEVEYSFADSDKKEVGTTVTLHLNEESKEFLEYYKVRSILTRYCDFMPYEIELKDLEKIAREQKEHEEKQAEYEKALKEAKDDKKPDVYVPPAPTKDVVNTTTPLWKRDPSELKDEDYKTFYQKLFPMDPPPLFWLHLKVEHPFELRGILYFPKLNPNKPVNENNIRLYCRQVFVSDNVKKIIPDFLSLLKGVIDSSDIPLNVSRSSLQGDPNIAKISNYVVKKVAEALKKLFRKDRARYETVWEDIGLFVKYGAMSEEKFDEVMREFVLLKDASGKLMTMEEYEKAVPESYKEKLKDKILYFEKGKGDVHIKDHLTSLGIPVVETDGYIDPHFMQNVEFKKVKEKSFKFVAMDSEYESLLGGEEKASEEDTKFSEKVKEIFEGVLLTKSAEKKEEKKEEEKVTPFPGMDGELSVEVKGGTGPKTAAFIKVDEQSKRLQQMTRTMGNVGAELPLKRSLVLNPKHPLIQNTLRIHEKGENPELVKKLCQHVHDLANFSSQGLDQKEKEQFVRQSQELVNELSNYVV